MVEFVDTHCHIHSSDYGLDPEEVISKATENGVTRMICVGTSLKDSELAIAMAARHRSIWASIGIHPHEAKYYVDNERLLRSLRQIVTKSRVVAVGEIGLDYYYNHSPKEDQKQLFRYQLELALEHNLPIIFHVREAFDDFFAIIKDYNDVKGVIHSFSANKSTLERCLEKGFYISLNGIMSFTKQAQQLEAAKTVPLHHLLLETDAPFLTPIPFRGTICQPKHVVSTASFLSQLRNETIEAIASATTQNAIRLFSL